MRQLIGMAVLLLSLSVQAGVEAQRFETPEQEARYKALINELRCLVCQNQNLADSNAELAQDLRKQTYDMILQGDSDGEIVDYMVARYGDFVLYRPPFKSSTAALWVGPFIILSAAVIGLLVFIRRRGRQSVSNLSAEDESRARRLLDDSDEEDKQ